MARLADKARRALAAGHSVVVDAVFAHPQERDADRGGRRAAAECAVPRPVPRRRSADPRARIETRTADASDADAAVARGRRHTTSARVDWTRIDASGTPDENAAARADGVAGDDGSHGPALNRARQNHGMRCPVRLAHNGVPSQP